MAADDLEERSKTARPLTQMKGRESDPAWSPDGKRLAFVSEANGSAQIWTATADGGDARAVTALRGEIASPTWSPDGKQLVFVMDGNLWQVGAEAKGLRAFTSYPDRPLRSVRWQPGGNLLAVGFKLYQETVEVYDLASGELTPLTEGGQESNPAWLNATTLVYQGPARSGQPDALWQVGLDGSGAAIIPGSGQAGVGDGQPAVASEGSALAMVSTLGGTRNVWLRNTLQIAKFDVAPAAGASPGELLTATYVLPTESEVSLDVVAVSGKTVRVLVDRARQPKGVGGSGRGMGRTAGEGGQSHGSCLPGADTPGALHNSGVPTEGQPKATGGGLRPGGHCRGAGAKNSRESASRAARRPLVASI